MAQLDSVARRCFVAVMTILLVVIAHTGVAADGTHFVWFGTQTGPKTGSEGIYVSRFDAEQGTLSTPELAVAATNPSFLAVHPKLPVLYAVAQIKDADGNPAGGVIAFAIDQATGKLRPMNEQPCGGAGPCHLSVDRSGQVVLVANYTSGSTTCLGLATDGSLEPIVKGTPGGLIQHTFDRTGEAGINTVRQEGPHAHSADAAPDSRFAFVCDLGLDQVSVYSLDAKKATITPSSSVRVKNGAGPRHFAMHPGGTFAYSVNELDLTVTAFAFDPASGTLTTLQTLSTLPEGVTDRTGFSGAEIAVHPTGRWVYASNRGHDTITIFDVDASTGRLTFGGAEPIQGKTPRHFALAPDGKFLLAEGQTSNSVAIFSIDPATGMLRFTDRSISVPCPVSAVIRPID